MKKLSYLAVGAILTVNAFFVIDMGRRAYATPSRPTCTYVTETPNRNDAYWSLQDARNALQGLGVDPDNAPTGYGIVSHAGC